MNSRWKVTFISERTRNARPYIKKFKFVKSLYIYEFIERKAKKEEDDKRPLRPIGRAGSHMTTSDCSVLLLVIIISHTIVKVNTKQYDKKRPKRKAERCSVFFI